jgi:hypothetical protein
MQAMKNLMALLLLLPAAAVWAQADDVPPVDQETEPQVVITPKEQGRIKEFRVNGRLYMIEVVPEKGLPYYLIDTDGDGTLDNRENSLQSGLAIPRWTLLRW